MAAVPHLLYVGSDSDIAASRAEGLSSEYTFEVRTVSDVAGVKVALKEYNIDCIVSELHLGEDDGFDLLSYVRSDHSSLPVILLIDDDEPKDIARKAFNAGATDLFPQSMVNLSYKPLVDRIYELATEPTNSPTANSSTPDNENTSSGSTISEDVTASTDGGDTKTFSFGNVSSSTETAETTTADTESTDTPTSTTTSDTPTATTASDTSTEDHSISDLDLDQLRSLPKDELVTLLAQIIGDEDDPATASAEAMAETIDVTETPDTQAVEESPRESTDSASSTATESATSDDNAPTIDEAETTEPDAGDVAPTDPDPADMEWETSEGYQRPRGLDLSPGTTVLVQCSSQDERKHDARQDLLGINEASNRNILLIQYRSMNTDRLAAIAESAQRVKVITVGCSQSVPNGVKDTVNVVDINNPNDVTRLGILSTKTLNTWQSLEGEIAVALDPLDVLFRYKSVEGTFRFLHIFLGKLSGGGAVSSFFVNPSASNPQDVNTLKPLFDHILTVDSAGVDLEGV